MWTDEGNRKGRARALCHQFSVSRIASANVSSVPSLAKGLWRLSHNHFLLLTWWNEKLNRWLEGEGVWWKSQPVFLCPVTKMINQPQPVGNQSATTLSQSTGKVWCCSGWPGAWQGKLLFHCKKGVWRELLQVGKDTHRPSQVSWQPPCTHLGVTDWSLQKLSPWKLHLDLTLVFPSRTDQGSKINKVLPPPPTSTPTVASITPAAEEFTARWPAVCVAGEQIGEVSGEEREILPLRDSPPAFSTS